MENGKNRFEISAEKIQNAFRMMLLTHTYELCFENYEPRLGKEWWDIFIERMPKMQIAYNELALIKILNCLKLKNPPAFFELISFDEKIPQRIKENVLSSTYSEILKSREGSIREDIEFLTIVGIDFKCMGNDNAIEVLNEAIENLKLELQGIED